MRTKRVLRAAVAFLFAFGVLAADLTPLRLPPQTASAVTQADIDKLKKESNALSSKKSEVNKQLSALKKDKANTLKRKALLDQQIDLISEEIANTEQQIAQYEALIEQTEQELSETQAQEADQYELFCKRVRAMEERGTVSYWSVLFQSSSFEELLGAMDFISEVMEADQRVIDDLRVLQAQIAEKQQTLETSLAEQQSAKEALAVKNNELRDQRTEATGLIKEMEENEADYKDVLAEIEAEEEKTQKEIVRLSKERDDQQARHIALRQAQHRHQGRLHQPPRHRHRRRVLQLHRLCRQGRHGHHFVEQQCARAVHRHQPRQRQHDHLPAPFQALGERRRGGQAGTGHRRDRLERRRQRSASAF